MVEPAYIAGILTETVSKNAHRVKYALVVSAVLPMVLTTSRLLSMVCAMNAQRLASLRERQLDDDFVEKM
jgi:hypothetical protein